MKKQLLHIAPLKAGIISAAIHGIISLLATPFFLIAMVIGAKSGKSLSAVLGMAFAFMIPVFYVFAGFLGGIIAAALYNLVVQWTGGLEFEVSDAASTKQKEALVQSAGANAARNPTV